MAGSATSAGRRLRARSPSPARRGIGDGETTSNVVGGSASPSPAAAARFRSFDSPRDGKDNSTQRSNNNTNNHNLDSSEKSINSILRTSQRSQLSASGLTSRNNNNATTTYSSTTRHGRSLKSPYEIQHRRATERRVTFKEDLPLYSKSILDQDDDIDDDNDDNQDAVAKVGGRWRKRLSLPSVASSVPRAVSPLSRGLSLPTNGGGRRPSSPINRRPATPIGLETMQAWKSVAAKIAKQRRSSSPIASRLGSSRKEDHQASSADPESEPGNIVARTNSVASGPAAAMTRRAVKTFSERNSNRQRSVSPSVAEAAVMARKASARLSGMNRKMHAQLSRAASCSSPVLRDLILCSSTPAVSLYASALTKRIRDCDPQECDVECDEDGRGGRASPMFSSPFVDGPGVIDVGDDDDDDIDERQRSIPCGLVRVQTAEKYDDDDDDRQRSIPCGLVRVQTAEEGDDDDIDDRQCSIPCGLVRVQTAEEEELTTSPIDPGEGSSNAVYGKNRVAQEPGIIDVGDEVEELLNTSSSSSLLNTSNIELELQQQSDSLPAELKMIELLKSRGIISECRSLLHSPSSIGQEEELDAFEVRYGLKQANDHPSDGDDHANTHVATKGRGGGGRLPRPFSWQRLRSGDSVSRKSTLSSVEPSPTCVDELDKLVFSFDQKESRSASYDQQSGFACAAGGVDVTRRDTSKEELGEQQQAAASISSLAASVSKAVISTPSSSSHQRDTSTESPTGVNELCLNTDTKPFIPSSPIRSVDHEDDSRGSDDEEPVDTSNVELEFVEEECDSQSDVMDNLRVNISRLRVMEQSRLGPISEAVCSLDLHDADSDSASDSINSRSRTYTSDASGLSSDATGKANALVVAADIDEFDGSTIETNTQASASIGKIPSVKRILSPLDVMKRNLKPHQSVKPLLPPRIKEDDQQQQQRPPSPPTPHDEYEAFEIRYRPRVRPPPPASPGRLQQLKAGASQRLNIPKWKARPSSSEGAEEDTIISHESHLFDSTDFSIISAISSQQSTLPPPPFNETLTEFDSDDEKTMTTAGSIPRLLNDIHETCSDVNSMSAIYSQDEEKNVERVALAQDMPKERNIFDDFHSVAYDNRTHDDDTALTEDTSVDIHYLSRLDLALKEHRAKKSVSESKRRVHSNNACDCNYGTSLENAYEEFGVERQLVPLNEKERQRQIMERIKGRYMERVTFLSGRLPQNNQGTDNGISLQSQMPFPQSNPVDVDELSLSVATATSKKSIDIPVGELVKLGNLKWLLNPFGASNWECGGNNNRYDASYPACQGEFNHLFSDDAEAAHKAITSWDGDIQQNTFDRIIDAMDYAINGKACEIDYEDFDCKTVRTEFDAKTVDDRSYYTYGDDLTRKEGDDGAGEENGEDFDCMTAHTEFDAKTVDDRSYYNYGDDLTRKEGDDGVGEDNGEGCNSKKTAKPQKQAVANTDAIRMQQVVFVAPNVENPGSTIGFLG